VFLIWKRSLTIHQSSFIIPKFDPEISIVLMNAICRRPANPFILDIAYLLRSAKCEIVFWSTATRYSYQKILYLGFLERVLYQVWCPGNLWSLCIQCEYEYVHVLGQKAYKLPLNYFEFMTLVQLRTIDSLICITVEAVLPMWLCAQIIWNKV